VSERAELLNRIWERDPTVWTGGEEARWLGWLDEPLRMRERVDALVRFADEVAEEELDGIVLLGMGGSSLAAEVLRRTFRSEAFCVLDTTHPAAIRTLEETLDVERALFVVSSKSGTTLETLCLFDYFRHAVKRRERFVVVTDPGSPLEHLAAGLGMRIFPGEPTIGGRYSALSSFGLVPAALMGVDLRRLLANAERMLEACRVVDGNPGYVLGHALASGWSAGRDKVCIAESDGRFGLWAEQLLAESTGKDGKGLVPAPGESADGPDRQEAAVALADPYSLGGEFFRWMFGTAVAAALLEVNPFDQPDGLAAKERTALLLARGDEAALEPQGSLGELLEEAHEGDYVCVQAFLEPSEENDRRIADLVAKLRRRTGLVVTHGYGPRYLHSTGQLHKGGPNTGLFVQVVDEPGDEVPIPGRPFGFGRLLRAQAEGDFQALTERGRRIVRVNWEDV
jgi:hypothetical protein